MFTSEWEGLLQNMPAEIDVIKISKLDGKSSEQEWLDCLLDLEDYCGYIYHQPSESEDKIFPSCLWTFVHHAAHFNAPVNVIRKMLEQDFHLSLKDAAGRLAYDHVLAAAPSDYKKLFKPIFQIPNIDINKINNIEKRFHEVIRSRVDNLVKKHSLILPNISVLLERVSKAKELWFAVPGMYGGFRFKFEYKKDKSDVVSLVTSSWCRVAGGSGQRHRCHVDKWELIAEGFV